jgi:phosphoglycerate dehydrogenase-like enzyme
MPKLQIFCDLAAEATVYSLLREGIAPHQLLLSSQPARNVLGQSTPDPLLRQADIAFGQPDAAAVLSAPRLRWVQVASAGYTRYDTAAFRQGAAERGLILTNSSSVYAQPCAEHVLAFMLAQARQLLPAIGTHCSNDSDAWRGLRANSILLKRQTVLLLGFGVIGMVLLPMLKALQMDVTAFRRNPKGTEGIPVVKEAGLAEVLSKAEHVINLLPDNAETQGFMSRERFATMRSGALFYNIGRGTTVDQDALLAALRSGHLAAAWLDVTDPEPLPENHPLLSVPNCFISPHTAGGHKGEIENLAHHFLDNFQRFLSQAPLKDVVMAPRKI